MGPWGSTRTQRGQPYTRRDSRRRDSTREHRRHRLTRGSQPASSHVHSRQASQSRRRVMACDQHTLPPPPYRIPLAHLRPFPLLPPPLVVLSIPPAASSTPHSPSLPSRRRRRSSPPLYTTRSSTRRHSATTAASAATMRMRSSDSRRTWRAPSPSERRMDTCGTRTAGHAGETSPQEEDCRRCEKQTVATTTEGSIVPLRSARGSLQTRTSQASRISNFELDTRVQSMPCPLQRVAPSVSVRKSTTCMMMSTRV